MAKTTKPDDAKVTAPEERKIPANGAAPAPEAPKEDGLVSIDALAVDFRLPSWQAAALERMMQWEKGKRVSKKDYAAALEKLKKRPLGA